MNWLNSCASTSLNIVFFQQRLQEFWLASRIILRKWKIIKTVNCLYKMSCILCEQLTKQIIMGKSFCNIFLSNLPLLGVTLWLRVFFLFLFFVHFHRNLKQTTFSRNVLTYFKSLTVNCAWHNSLPVAQIKHECENDLLLNSCSF